MDGVVTMRPRGTRARPAKPPLGLDVVVQAGLDVLRAAWRGRRSRAELPNLTPVAPLFRAEDESGIRFTFGLEVLLDGLAR